MRSNAQKFAITLSTYDALLMSCQNAKCQAMERGWAEVLDPVLSEEHRQRALFIENDFGRKYVKVESAGAKEWFDTHAERMGILVSEKLRALLDEMPPGMLVYYFFPGQSCGRFHLDREVVFRHRNANGDVRVHTRPQDYMEHFNEEAERAAVLLQRG